MAVFLKPMPPLGVRAWRRAGQRPARLAQPSRRRAHAPKLEAIPGTTAAYLWLAAGLGLSATSLAFALLLIAELILDLARA